MKKQLLSILFLSLAVTFFGQITITNNNIAPAGTTIYFANDNTFPPEIIPGDAGGNKIWDFATVMTSSLDTFNFVLPSATPYGDDFPEANFAFSSFDAENGNSYSYMIRNDDKLSTIGYAFNSEEMGTVLSDVVPENIILDFPVTYQNNYNEVYGTDVTIESPIPGSDSIRTKSTVVKETIVDAWGSITIPMGTYDALRQRVDEEQTDSTFMKMSGVWVLVDASQENTTTFQWWTNNVSIGFMLFSIDVDNNSSGEIMGISFLIGSTVGLNEAKMLATKVYPNPASNFLSFEFDKFVTGELVLVNQLGQIVANKSINEQNNIRLNISNLPTGVYVYRATNNAGELLSSGKVLKK